jgi:hypothetical protein
MFLMFGLFVLAYAAFEIVSGAFVLAFRNGWRVAGIVYASIGAGFSFLAVLGSLTTRVARDSESSAVLRHDVEVPRTVITALFLAAYVFVLIVLARTGPYFRRSSPYSGWPPAGPPGRFTT